MNTPLVHCGWILDSEKYAKLIFKLAAVPAGIYGTSPIKL
jgi:hypothetical protein